MATNKVLMTRGPPWRWSDEPYRRVLRIHTTLIEIIEKGK
jgi:hypothetical protein